jgi:eukaryotic-like serine/threonine-protein kinase
MQQAAENFLVGGQLVQGMSVLTEALKAVHLPLPSSTTSAIVQGLGRVVLFRLAARRPARTGSGGFDATETLRADLCLSAAKGLGMVNPMLSAYFAFLALDVASRAGDPCRMASALCLSGMMLAAIGGRLGRWGEEWLDEATKIAEASGDVLLRARVLVCRAQVDVNRGLWSSVLQHGDAAMKWLTLHPNATTWERNMADMSALRALEEHGDLTRAWKRAAEWRSDAQKRGDLYAEITADLYLAFAQLAEDAPDRAESRATLALTRWSASPAPFHEFYRLRIVAYAELYRERPDAALGALQRAERALSDARLDRFPAIVLDANLLCARIHLWLAERGRATAKSMAACARAIDRLDGLRRPDASGYAALLRAGLDAVRGDSGSARAQLGVARASFAERQMVLALVYVAAAESTLGGAPGDVERWSACERSLRRQGIVKPRAWLALLAPGFASSPPVDPSGRPAAPA